MKPITFLHPVTVVADPGNYRPTVEAQLVERICEQLLVKYSHAALYLARYGTGQGLPPYLYHGPKCNIVFKALCLQYERSQIRREFVEVPPETLPDGYRFIRLNRGNGPIFPAKYQKS